MMAWQRTFYSYIIFSERLQIDDGWRLGEWSLQLSQLLGIQECTRNSLHEVFQLLLRLLWGSRSWRWGRWNNFSIAGHSKSTTNQISNSLESWWAKINASNIILSYSITWPNSSRLTKVNLRTQLKIIAPSESPKISMVWASEIAHNFNDGLFHVDGQLFNYFRDNRELVRWQRVIMLIEIYFSLTNRTFSWWAIMELDGERFEIRGLVREKSTIQWCSFLFRDISGNSFHWRENCNVKRFQRPNQSDLEGEQ